jgi:hypothetical protein
MKKIGIVLVAFVAMLVLPGAAKADSITGGSVTSLGAFGLFGSANVGGQQFNFDDSFFGNSIGFGSFAGTFTSAGFSATNVDCNRFGCDTQYTASFIGSAGTSSAGETGTITFVVDGNGNIISGSESITGGAGVPEPGTLGMFAAGLLGVGLMISRRSKAAQVTA